MRVLIAGTGSGCGKTTAASLLMAVLKNRGLDVAPCKVGPDYIDPGFHRCVCGRPCHNLDSWLMGPDALRRALCRPADITVIEGVMGYYDGLDAEAFHCSTWEIARMTRTPVILVVDASGSAASAAAAVKGFSSFVQDSAIAGVLVNRASGERHYRLVREAVERHTGLPCVGYLAKDRNMVLPERHLGLVPAEETDDLLPRVMAAAREAEKTLDTEKILELAAQAPGIPEPQPSVLPDRKGFRLGVAMDKAFHFYYQANLDALRDAGMELVLFSPLRDSCLPVGLDGLYVGGGYPEVFASELSDNRSMRAGIRKALEQGLPCYAECGGLMYLGKEIDGYPMVEYLPVRSRMTGRLQRFGYVTVEDRTGLSFPAHEFHHALAEPLEGARFSYRVRKASDPGRVWECGYEKGRTLAAFAHVFFADRGDLMNRFFPRKDPVA